MHIRGDAKLPMLSLNQTITQPNKIHENGQNNNRHEVIIRSGHEQRFNNTAEFIHQLWNTNIISSQIIIDKLIIGSLLNKTLKLEMQKRPTKKSNQQLEKSQPGKAKESQNENQNT